METQTKQLIAGVVITSAIGLFSWRLYVTYKEVKKRMELEEEINKDVEKLETEDMDPKELRLYELSKVHEREAVEEAEDLHERLQARKAMKETIRDTQINILTEEEENDAYYDKEPEDDDELEEEYVEEEEEETLRHHPDSIAAWDQYVSMRLADIDNEAIADIYRILFKNEYYPVEDNRDEVLESNIINNRVNFFGEESKYSNRMSIAEVLLHFAELLDFDLDGGIEFWAERLLINVGLEVGVDIPHSKLMKIVNDASLHQWYNPEMGHAFGIFALDVDQFEAENLEDFSFLKQYWAFLDNETND